MQVRKFNEFHHFDFYGSFDKIKDRKVEETEKSIERDEFKKSDISGQKYGIKKRKPADIYNDLK